MNLIPRKKKGLNSMKKTREKKSGLRTSETKTVVFMVVGIVICFIAIALFLNTDIYKEKAHASSVKKHISDIVIALEEVGDIKVQYDETQDKYIIETATFKLKSPSHKLILCEEIASCLNGNTNFIILSNDKKYYCYDSDGEGLVLYADGSKIYSEKEKNKVSSIKPSTSAKPSNNTDYDTNTQVKTEKTCQWAGCYNDREGLNEYCSYHSNHLRGVNEAVEGF